MKLALALIPVCLFPMCQALSSSTRLPPLLEAARQQGLLVVVQQPRIFVLGTVHLGAASADEATLLIKTVKPQTVVLEVAPSRVETMRRRNNANIQRSNENPSSSTKSNASSANNNPLVLLQALPALAEKGWSTGGIAGLVFVTTVVWTSLVKRSFTADEEADVLPRVDEFAAALAAADSVGANVVAADVELEALIGAAAQSLSTADWFQLAKSVVGETLEAPCDPVRRRPGETMIQWFDRRRNIDTARASRRHGEQRCATLARVLVDDRDERLANACRQAMQQQQTSKDEVVVCVVGLVHLDGVVQRLLHTD